MLKSRSSLLVLAVSAILAASSAQAAIVLYSDEATFLADTGASMAHTPFADIGGVATPYVRDSLTFGLGPGATALFSGGGGLGQFSSLIPGNELALSAVEDLDVGISSDVYSFGFQFHEPSAARPAGTPLIDTCNTVAACVDSTFSLTLFDGVTNVGGFSFNVADDVLAFVGVWSDTPFNRVEIRETAGGIDNEFYGQFYTGDAAPSDVPEPSTLLLLSGALGLAFWRRRKTS